MLLLLALIVAPKGPSLGSESSSGKFFSVHLVRDCPSCEGVCGSSISADELGFGYGYNIYIV